MNDTELRERVSQLVQKTYDEHGLGNGAWGITPSRRCNYAHGCAIGVSMSEKAAIRADELGGGEPAPPVMVTEQLPTAA